MTFKQTAILKIIANTFGQFKFKKYDVPAANCDGSPGYKNTTSTDVIMNLENIFKNKSIKSSLWKETGFCHKGQPTFSASQAFPKTRNQPCRQQKQIPHIQWHDPSCFSLCKQISNLH